MNIHEYQAKAVLKSFGAPVAEGVPIFSKDDVDAAIAALPGPLYVVKSQIHAGGRGKGKFVELGPDAKGGVRLAFNADEVRSHVEEMLGNMDADPAPVSRFGLLYFNRNNTPVQRHLPADPLV